MKRQVTYGLLPITFILQVCFEAPGDAWSIITNYVSFYKCFFFKRQVTHGLLPIRFLFISLFLKRQVTHGLLRIMFHFIRFFFEAPGDAWPITYYVSFYKFLFYTEKKDEQ